MDYYDEKFSKTKSVQLVKGEGTEAGGYGK
jgi:hypothetical protein